MAWTNSTGTTIYTAGSVRKESSGAGNTFDTDMYLGNFGTGIISLYSPSSQVKAYADYSNLGFIYSNTEEIQCFNYQQQYYGGFANSDGVYAIHSAYDPMLVGTTYTGDGNQVRVRRESIGSGKGYLGYYYTNSYEAWVKSSVGTVGNYLSPSILYTYAITVYTNGVRSRSDAYTLKVGKKYIIKLHTSSRSGYNGIVCTPNFNYTTSFVNSVVTSRESPTGVYGKCSGDDHTETFEMDLSTSVWQQYGTDIDIYFYYIADSTLLNTFSGKGQTNQYEFGDVTICEKDDDPGYVNVTLQNDNTNYTGSSKTIASIASSSGTAYLGLGSSSTTAPTSWGSAGASLSATNAGTYYIWAKCDSASGYEAMSATYKGSVTINKISGSTGVSTSAMTITYSTTTSTRGVSGNTGTVTVSSSNTSVASVSISGSTITVTRTGYGSATITCSAAASTNYNAATSTFTVSCNRASISPSVSCSNLTYGGSSTTASVSGNSGSGTVTWSSSNTSVATVNSSGVVSPVGAGSTRITASIAQSTNYLAGSAYKDITVNKANGSTGVSTSDMTITYSATTSTRSVSGNTGTVTVSSSNTSIATVSISGSTITVTRKGYGSATITCSAAAATNYNAATSTFTVYCNRAAISPSVSCSNLTYGGSSTTASVSGNTGSGTVTWSSNKTTVATVNSSGVVSPVNSGTARITATIAQSTNYLANSAYRDITVNKAAGSTGVSTATMTITYSSTTGTKTITGNTNTVTAVSSNTNIATVSISGSTLTVTRKGYGSTTITCSVADATNYNAATSTFTVYCNKASISPSVTCSNPTYGSGTVTATVSGNSGSGTVTWSSSNTAVATVNSSGVVTPVKGGSVRITATIAESTNYLNGSAYKDITVNKATQPLTISPTSKTIYDRSGYNTFTITSSNAQGTVSYSSSNTSIATVNSSGVVTYVAAGSATITVTAAGNDYYNSGSKTCTVTCTADSVASVSASVAKSTINYGATTTITVTATYKSGYTTDVTTSTTYSTNPTGIVTIS